MATVRFGIDLGQNNPADVVFTDPGAATVANNFELTVDLAVSPTKLDVQLACEQFIDRLFQEPYVKPND